MGFVVVCESCDKQLSIPAGLYDRKVRGRVVTIHCKRCGSPIRVDATDPPAAGSPSQNGAAISGGSMQIPRAPRLPAEENVDAAWDEIGTAAVSIEPAADVENRPSFGATGFDTSLPPLEADKEHFSHADGPISVRAPIATIGRYTLFDKFATGGMATVHFGRLDGAGGFSRVVAIKRLLPNLVKNEEFVEMLLNEARLAARVRHPNVVPALDVVASKGDVLLVLEYVHGEALGALCRSQAKTGERIPIGIAASVMHGALEGLHAVHEAVDERGKLLGLVHRDFSPPNVIVGVDGAARVLDFGIVKALERIEETQPNKLKGKTGYMSPEQIRGERVTRRSDIFAAGIVLWELLTLRRFASGKTDRDRMEKILRGGYPRPSEFRSELGPALDRVVMRALAFQVEERYASAREFAQALDAASNAASAGTVAAWVNSLAEAALAERARGLAQVENWREGAPRLELNSSPFAADRGALFPITPEPAIYPAVARESKSARPIALADVVALATRYAAPLVIAVFALVFVVAYLAWR